MRFTRTATITRSEAGTFYDINTVAAQTPLICMGDPFPFDTY